ncbi:hypothetical protein K466DRAFT_437998, partial [Polyporus arcularius HHB13444]
THHLVDDALSTLTTLPWSVALSGFTNCEATSTLTSYMSRTWLSDTHESQMLDLLRTQLLRHPEGLVAEVETIYFWTALAAGFQNRERRAYKDDRTLARPRGVGTALQQGERREVGFLINVSSNHWVAMVVDFERQKVLYGDSLGSAAPVAEIVDVLTWWIAQHSSVPFTWCELPITHQTDGFSCGILSWNALAHYFLPDLYKLSGARLSDVDGLRLSTFLDIVHRHLDNV